MPDIAHTLESTLLAPTASEADVAALCAQAVASGCFAVCVSPCRAGLAVQELRGTSVRVVSVAGFPLGTQTARAKTFEMGELVESGVDEIDAVWNVGLFLEGRGAAARDELVALRRAASGLVFKVILETGLLTPERIGEAGRLALDAGADFLKTSTGYGPRGASVEDVRLLRAVAGSRAKIKASGGIRTREQVLALLAAGADRIGTSSAAAILDVSE